MYVTIQGAASTKDTPKLSQTGNRLVRKMVQELLCCTELADSGRWACQGVRGVTRLIDYASTLRVLQNSKADLKAPEVFKFRALLLTVLRSLYIYSTCFKNKSVSTRDLILFKTFSGIILQENKPYSNSRSGSISYPFFFA